MGCWGVGALGRWGGVVVTFYGRCRERWVLALLSVDTVKTTEPGNFLKTWTFR